MLIYITIINGDVFFSIIHVNVMSGTRKISRHAFVLTFIDSYACIIVLCIINDDTGKTWWLLLKKVMLAFLLLFLFC